MVLPNLGFSELQSASPWDKLLLVKIAFLDCIRFTEDKTVFVVNS